jgi:hypothetical protein
MRQPPKVQSELSCTGFYVSKNGTALVQRLLGNNGAAKKQAVLQASAKAAAKKAAEVRDMVKTFKTSNAKAKKVGAGHASARAGEGGAWPSALLVLPLPKERKRTKAEPADREGGWSAR